jgi:hypothetical protein
MTNALDLLSELEGLLTDAIGSGHFVGNSAQRLGQILEGLQKIRPDLQAFVSDVNPLEIRAIAGDPALQLAFDAWRQQADGYLTESSFSRVVAQSPTLQGLSRNGIDIQGAYKFSETEIAIAKILGSKFKSFPQYVNQLRSADKNSFTVSPSRAKATNSAMRGLEDLGVISGFKMKVRMNSHSGPSRWSSFNPERPLLEDGAYMATYKKVADEHRQLLSGHWLNAYAYFVALDQLQRLKEPFEVYTRVNYELPIDVAQDRGDFDLLARGAHSFLFIECKAGNLWNERARDGLDTVRYKADQLEEVFAKVGEGNIRRHYVLLCSPRERDDLTTVEQALAGSDIDVITIEHLRHRIQSIFTSK